MVKEGWGCGSTNTIFRRRPPLRLRLPLVVLQCCLPWPTTTEAAATTFWWTARGSNLPPICSCSISTVGTVATLPVAVGFSVVLVSYPVATAATAATTMRGPMA